MAAAMKGFLLVVLINCALVASKLILPQEGLSKTEKQKAFSIFSVVQFPNSECTIQSDLKIRGVCMSGSDCTSSGGVQDGNCASGFGVCCSYRVSNCGSTITQNVTFIQNPGYPSAFTSAAGTTQTCTYTVTTTSAICQLRLDFVNFVINNPVTGVCSNGGDTFTVTSATRSTASTLPGICGTNTGLHMYVETGGVNSASTTLTFSNAALNTLATSRAYLIKVSTIPCDADYRAPRDCLQYFFTSSGVTTSYNFNAGSGNFLRSQNYATCFRRNKGYCSIQFRPTTLDSGSSGFNLLPLPTSIGTSSTVCFDNNLLANSVTGTYVQVPGAGISSDYFCGVFLNRVNTQNTQGTVTSKTANFRIQTFSAPPNTSPNPIPATTAGYSLNYQQIPCS